MAEHKKKTNREKVIKEELEKISEEKLRYAYRIFVDSCDPIIVQDLAGNVIDVNDEAVQAYGWAREELIGKPANVFDPDDRTGQANELLERCLQGGSVRNVEGEWCNKSGERFPVLLTLSLLTNEAGEPIAVSSIARNIAELKELESRSTQMAKEIMEMSVPIITLFDDILAVPLIGTLDSQRTQKIMEDLLNKIVDTESRFVIIDITGVPVVDTLTATHLLKSANAVRLLGATAIITGISPNIAQTLVNLGVDLSELITNAKMVDGIKTALGMLNKRIVDVE